MDPNKRPGAQEARQMAFFKSIDWKNLTAATPPFVPQPDNPTDTGYFEGITVYMVSTLLCQKLIEYVLFFST